MRNIEVRERQGEIRGDKKWQSEGYNSPQSIFLKCSGYYVLLGQMNVSLSKM